MQISFISIGALGSIGGGTAGIVKAVRDSQSASKQLEEAKRHNKTMEQIAIGADGKIIVKPIKTGLGLFLNPERRKN